MDKWEYCWLRGVDPLSDKGIYQVNDLGRERWEAVNYTLGIFGIAILFKRKLP